MEKHIAMNGNIKEIGMLSAWIATLILISFFTWFFTKPIRTRILQENVNTVLVNMGRTPLLQSPLERAPKNFPLGTWFEVRDSRSIAIVFGIMTNGISLPCVVVVSDTGRIEETIFLHARTEQMLQKGIINAYMRRIERDVAFILGGM